MKSIYLIGFMGSGKTSVATILANKLARPVLDTDELVETNFNMKISDIFAQYGEEKFRDYESKTLMHTPEQDAIISTGGGIIERSKNNEWLKKHGLVVYLDTSWQEIVHRLQHDDSRPIWNNQQLDKKQLLDNRIVKYEETASVSVTTDGKTPELIAEEIIQQLGI